MYCCYKVRNLRHKTTELEDVKPCIDFNATYRPVLIRQLLATYSCKISLASLLYGKHACDSHVN